MIITLLYVGILMFSSRSKLYILTDGVPRGILREWRLPVSNMTCAICGQSYLWCGGRFHEDDAASASAQGERLTCEQLGDELPKKEVSIEKWIQDKAYFKRHQSVGANEQLTCERLVSEQVSVVDVLEGVSKEDKIRLALAFKQRTPLLPNKLNGGVLDSEDTNPLG